MISENRLRLSEGWTFYPSESSEGMRTDLPHTCMELPFNYFDEKSYQKKYLYERALPPVKAGKRCFLLLDGVMTAFQLSAGSKDFGEFTGGYLPHSIELTDAVRPDGETLLKVTVDAEERNDIPPFGGQVDYLTYGGIYRDAWLYEQDPCFLYNIYFRYEVGEIRDGRASVRCMPEVEIDNAGPDLDGEVTIRILGKEFRTSLRIRNGRQRTACTAFELEDVALWSVSRPELHAVSAELKAGDSCDHAELSVGFRKIEARADGLRINGEAVKLMGLNRHQDFPYVGYAMPERAQRQDARILKRDLGLNLVRTSHYPQSPYFLDECDRLGLLVLEEIPGWQHISSLTAWRDRTVENVRGMIERDFNHPSIITWGVRINESRDDDELYTRTNALARELDPSRPTCGVRCIEHSHLLEDIYTMNDFVHDGSENILRKQTRVTGLDHPVPYLVTEFCGHMFPTKRYDAEEHVVEHALRHGRVQSMAQQKDMYSGAIGWCAFDYHTHFEFGSGDHICYHGVTDCFRVPKLAAYVYASQRPAKEGYVLEPLTYWSRGERAKGEPFPIRVFTNCEEIEVLLDGKSVLRTFRDHVNTDEKMQYLPNPPFMLSLNAGEWGAGFPALEVIGYDKGKAVCRKRFAPSPVYADLTVEADGTELTAGRYDAIRVVVKAVDQEGNPLPFLHDSADIEISGDIAVIGPARIPLTGGVGAFWVRTLPDAKPGECSVTVRAHRGFEKTVAFRLTEA